METGPFPDWTWIVGFALGAFIGSFLNVVIYRLPRGMSLGEPRFSFCPRCKHRLLIVPDMIPLLSWLIQRGRCRYCRASVSPRYFAVELLNAAVWGAIWYRFLCASWDPATAVAYAAASATLVAIIFVDLELYLIPDQLNAFLWLTGIGLNAYLFAAERPEALTWGIPSALAGWITGVGVLWGIALFGRLAFQKDAMGHGDIKMARGIGAVLFPAVAVLSFGLAVVLGAVLGVAQVLFRRRPATNLSSSIENAGASERAAKGEIEASEEPESLGSLLKSGLGYLLCIDIVGLFAPKLYERWFGEPPFGSLEEEEFVIERTMIPFGPYLALGALAAMVFRGELLGLVDAYVRWAFGPAVFFGNTMSEGGVEVLGPVGGADL